MEWIYTCDKIPENDEGEIIIETITGRVFKTKYPRKAVIFFNAVRWIPFEPIEDDWGFNPR